MEIKLDPLSFRDVEDLLSERGIMVSYETLRRWVTISGRWSQRTCANADPIPTRLGIWTKSI
jgi:transposase-like protein